MKRSLLVLSAVLPLAACSEAPSTSQTGTPKAQVAGMLTDGTRATANRNTNNVDDLRSRSAPRERASRELLDRLPPETLFVLRFPHLELISEAWDRSAFSDSLKNIPGLPPGVDPMDIAFAEMRKSAPMMGELLDLLPELEGELLIAVTSVETDVDVGEAPFTGMILLDVGENATKLKRAIEPAIREMTDLPGFKRFREGWGFDVGDHEFFATARESEGTFSVRFGEPDAVKQFADASHSGSFLTTQLVSSTPDLEESGKPVILETFIHTAAIWNTTRGMMPPEAILPLQQSGLFDVEGAVATMALDDRGLSEALTWCSPGRNDMISRALSAKPINTELASLAPMKIDNASIVSFDLETLFGDIVRILPEDVRDEMFAQLGGMESSFGTDLHKDLFENFGPTMLCLSDGTPEEWMMRAAPKVAAVVEIQDAAAAGRLLSTVTQLASGIARVSTSQHGDTNITSFMIASGDLPMPIKLSVAVSSKFIAVSADDGLLKDILDAERFPASKTRLTTELEKAGPRAWCVATGKPSAGMPAMTAVGTADETGLRMEATGGSGSMVIGGLAGGLAVPAAVAIPKLMSARNAANEQAAITVLRSIHTAQNHAYQSLTVDSDRDGKGEALLLHELTGRSDVRGTNRPISMVLISDNWQQAAPGTASKAGYVFRVDLPATAGGGLCVSRESDGSDISADGAERAYVAYAWPLEGGTTGNRVFALDQSGGIWFTSNRGSRYSGFGGGPAFDDFFAPDKDDMAPYEGRDGSTWQRMQ